MSEAPARAVRALISLPRGARPGEVVEVRALIAHPMETGHRADGAGGVVARDIIRRFECQLNGDTVFSADLHPAVAANPLIVFALRVRPGRLRLRWEGDRGFAHEEFVELAAA